MALRKEGHSRKKINIKKISYFQNGRIKLKHRSMIVLFINLEISISFPKNLNKFKLKTIMLFSCSFEPLP